MPLEQTDMNVGFNSGADKVTFRRYESYDQGHAGIHGQQLIVPRTFGSEN